MPRVNEFLPETRFEEMERPAGPVPEIEETLERYYAVKLNSLQFCGPSNFDLTILTGLDSLVLTLPMILWLRRAFADPAFVAPLLKSKRTALISPISIGPNSVILFSKGGRCGLQPN